MASAGVVTALALGVTPAQADSPGGGGSLMPKPTPGLTAPGPDFSNPDTLNEFLTDCGDVCSFTQTGWAGEAKEGTPTKLGSERDNCTTEPLPFSEADAETNGETTTIGLGFTLGNAPVQAAPSIQHAWVKSVTKTSTTGGSLKPGQIGWIDEVPVTRKATGNWKVDGTPRPDNRHTAYGPLEFNGVESDISYKIIRVQARDMTPDEKVTRCGNASHT
ncbi:hypothetical protein ACFTZI_00900 [Streptomyces decoyicus]|uniref:hypothetical protein n=1 Tax=Streptomyces decoyicus TaxID=249567 RepID=UPI00362E178C